MTTDESGGWKNKPCRRSAGHFVCAALIAAPAGSLEGAVFATATGGVGVGLEAVTTTGFEALADAGGAGLTAAGAVAGAAVTAWVGRVVVARACGWGWVGGTALATASAR